VIIQLLPFVKLNGGAAQSISVSVSVINGLMLQDCLKVTFRTFFHKWPHIKASPITNDVKIQTETAQDFHCKRGFSGR